MPLLYDGEYMILSFIIVISGCRSIQIAQTLRIKLSLFNLNIEINYKN